MPISSPRPADVPAALDLITAAQQAPAWACAYLGTEREGIRAELEDLTPPWTETLRVLVSGDQVVGAVAVDWDEETGRSWVQGPWTSDKTTWVEHGRALLEAAIAQTPEGVDDHEMSADPAHVGMAALAEGLGWHRSAVNIAYEAESDEGWPDAGSAGPQPRRATPDDTGALAALHTEAFPSTYATGRQLVEDDGRITLVLDGGAGELLGYASAEVQADGGGYLDFIAIAPGARGRGLSKVLLASVGRTILAASSDGKVSLTVKEDNAAAVALYESFGFTRAGALVGYRSRPYQG
ncbi:N-acetyltransferase family protein [Ornithinimicrobium panacihumi]|uniref:GNAT family N-acetyltransferase n=1 Tax=Ornithinimicrobium panacihumi TaxID=2008449 RepID=UPI003F8B6513